MPLIVKTPDEKIVKVSSYSPYHSKSYRKNRVTILAKRKKQYAERKKRELGSNDKTGSIVKAGKKVRVDDNGASGGQR